MTPNPFKPTAGATPPLLIGRDALLEEFVQAIADGPGSPGRLTMYTGARGVGKTVMLSEVADEALKAGWIALSETATPGLIDRLVHTADGVLHELDPSTAPSRDLTGLTLPVIGGGLTMSVRPETERSLRELLGALLDVLEPRGNGLLITVDEVHRQARTDLRELSATFQHLVREDRDVALVVAGLPSAISDLLNDDVLTFLRRATREILKDVPIADVTTALRATIEAEGRTIDAAALHEAALATNGYPFMIQLVGYHVWRAAQGEHIDLVSARHGIATARERLENTVHETALADLSDVDRSYLLAMAEDDGPSRTAELATRLGVTMAYANVYRSRLIVAGIIEATARGYVDYAIPHLRDHLWAHADRYGKD